MKNAIVELFEIANTNVKLAEEIAKELPLEWLDFDTLLPYLKSENDWVRATSKSFIKKLPKEKITFEKLNNLYKQEGVEEKEIFAELLSRYYKDELPYETIVEFCDLNQVIKSNIVSIALKEHGKRLNYKTLLNLYHKDLPQDLIILINDYLKEFSTEEIDLKELVNMTSDSRNGFKIPFIGNFILDRFGDSISQDVLIDLYCTESQKLRERIYQILDKINPEDLNLELIFKSQELGSCEVREMTACLASKILADKLAFDILIEYLLSRDKDQSKLAFDLIMKLPSEKIDLNKISLSFDNVTNSIQTVYLGGIIAEKFPDSIDFETLNRLWHKSSGDTEDVISKILLRRFGNKIENNVLSVMIGAEDIEVCELAQAQKDLRVSLQTKIVNEFFKKHKK